MALIDQTTTEDYAIYCGDSCDVLCGFKDESADFSIFSPPFADLYCYSDSPRDLGNCASYEEFFKHFEFIIARLFRMTKPGRICAVHCMDVPSMKEKDGVIGIKDFSGDIIRAFQGEGWIYHSRHTIWKDPLIEATRTKSIGLMHKQLQKDSAMSRSGLPDYLIAFRKPGENAEPITHEEGLANYYGKNDPGGEGVKRSHNIWRAYASPVWSDIRQTRTLNARIAREDEDEKHLCPLQLDTIQRAILLWSNPGDVVVTPFLGVGSEVYAAVLMERMGIGIELKESYYRQAVQNVKAAIEERSAQELFPI